MLTIAILWLVLLNQVHHNFTIIIIKLSMLDSK